MIDPRVSRLIDLLCDHSTALKPGDRLLVHAFDMPEEVVAEVISAAQRRGAQVLVRLESNLVRRQMMLGMNEANAKLHADNESHEMSLVTHYISLRGTNNYAELSETPDDVNAMWQREYVTPVVFGIRVPKTRWVALRWPTPSMAQQASMSTPAFEDFFFRVCTLDYARMREACKPLADLMNSTDAVQIKGPTVDLSFSIKDIGSVPCTGEANIPDGECFSCPVRDSVNGYIQFNTVSLFQGTEYKDIRYEVRDGRIIDADAGPNTEKLIKVLDTDEGARYFGEWSLGFNPYVLHPMKDTLFDEKIAGSFHLTPGNAYPPPGGNGNRSAIHWDKVLIQRPEYGGGEVYFDGRLIRKDGLFVLEELAGLNPERLG